MKKFALVCILTFAGPIFANAATLDFPSDAPVASITIPDSWQPEGTATGVVATSDDGAVFFRLMLRPRNRWTKWFPMLSIS
ncbi:hypothetical protein P6U16_26260 (plasmid) [Rhizobium sp. 32-5/1]|uniref:hypothetical protein n=1 Tax=Rhizobium sp. 32-5/1 TaxID=3019602 RepID=UPI00240D2401|nr:hypothetical protein [Rhizobium sp. 32-5/1]WEZ85550.1 hypothetical protein P6U16_26260 [Rhizobium sp. 32-5/1]